MNASSSTTSIFITLSPSVSGCTAVRLQYDKHALRAMNASWRWRLAIIALAGQRRNRKRDRRSCAKGVLVRSSLSTLHWPCALLQKRGPKLIGEGEGHLALPRKAITNW